MVQVSCFLDEEVVCYWLRDDVAGEIFSVVNNHKRKNFGTYKLLFRCLLRWLQKPSWWRCQYIATLRLGLVLSNVVLYSPLARKFLLEVRLEFAVEGNGFLLFEGNHFQSFTDVDKHIIRCFVAVVACIGHYVYYHCLSQFSISTPCTLELGIRFALGARVVVCSLIPRFCSSVSIS